MIREDIVLILDPELEPYFDLSLCPMDSPSFIEAEMLVFRADLNGQIINMSPTYDSQISEISTSITSEHQLMPSLRNYWNLSQKSKYRQRDLLIIASSSANKDVSLPAVSEWFKCNKNGLMGVLYVELGNYFSSDFQSEILKYVDFYVTCEQFEASKSFLAPLWGWLPECLEGFQMFHFEGHHPGGETYLRLPPKPFIGTDLARSRLHSFLKHM